MDEHKLLEAIGTEKWERRLGSSHALAWLEKREKNPPERSEREARQLRWEVEAVDRGIARYREFVRTSELVDTNAGTALLGLILAGLIPAVEAAQEEAIQGIKNRSQGRVSLWWWPVLTLDAHRIAYIVARTVASRSANSRPSDHPTVSRSAVAIANAIRMERNFQLWRAAQNKGTPDGAVNVAKLMLTRVKKVDRRTVAKWVKKGQDYDKIEWTLEEKFHLGTMLIKLLVGIEPDAPLFAARLNPAGRGRRFKTEYHLVLTDRARGLIDRQNSKEELTRPWLLPMLSPPNDWREQQE